MARIVVNRRVGRILAAVFFIGFVMVDIFLAPAGSAAPRKKNRPHAVDTFGITDQRVHPVIKETPPSPSRRFGLVFDKVSEVRLDAVDVNPLIEEDRNHALIDKTLRYGVRRDIQVTIADGRWYAVPGAGHLWTADIVAGGAVGIRVHFSQMNLPAGAEVVIYSTDDPVRLAGPYFGRGLFETGEFWTPTRFGERVRIEYFLPTQKPGLDAGAHPFVIDHIQHIYRDLAVELAGGSGAGAGPCHNNVACYPAWANAARACAGIGIINFNSLYCSGQLLNTEISDETPYYLTANHCLSTPAEAQTAEIYWLYQSAVCNGPPPSLASVPQSGVCTLMSTSAASDYTLLMVEGALPNGLAWAGWTSATVPDGTPSACIHHPSGSYKRISFGTKSSAQGCFGPAHVRMNWTDGPTEPGSSGSGAFRSDTQQLFGQLHCGPSACGVETNDQYGDFTVTYPTIAGFLVEGSDDILEPNGPCDSSIDLGVGGYPNLIVKSTNEDWYRVGIPGGNRVDVNLQFTHAYGDVDVELYNACGGTKVASSTGTSDTESFSYTNPGATADFFVRVFLAGDTRNSYSITMAITSPVAQNDFCAAAIVIGSGSVAFNNAGSTTDGPAEPEACEQGGDSQIGSDIWYLYTADCTGNVTFTLCGSFFDTKLGVYPATCPVLSGEILRCNDDLCGPQSQVILAASEGETFRIRVGGFQAEQGTGILTVSCNPCPADIAPVPNRDGVVNISDLLELIARWGPCDGCTADITTNGTVDTSDLLSLIASWGPCP